MKPDFEIFHNLAYEENANQIMWMSTSPLKSKRLGMRIHWFKNINRKYL